MPKKKIFHRRFPDGKPEGVVFIESGRVRLRFNYAPERIQFIKSLDGYRYHTEDRSWSVPLKHLERIDAAPLFPSERYLRRYTREFLDVSDMQRGQILEEAVGAYRKDPFAVEERLLALLDLDLIFRAAKQGASIRAHPGYKSKVSALLAKRKGVQLLKSEGAYFIPISSFTELLKSLRDKKYGFAVEKNLGSALKESAALRAEIVGGRAGNAEELERCFLTPFIDFCRVDAVDGSPRFELRHASAKHLAELFPHLEQFQSRKKLASVLSEEQVVSLLSRASECSETVYLTRAVSSHLHAREKRYREKMSHGFEQALLAVTDLPACWICEGDLRAGLLLSKGIREQLFPESQQTPLSTMKAEAHHSSVERQFFCCAESKLLFFVNSIEEYLTRMGKSAIPASEKFIALRRNLEARAAYLLKRAKYLALPDCSLDSSAWSAPELAMKLFPHQRVAASWLLETPRAFLGDDMGLGKTLSVLAYFEALRAREELQFLLVICPASLVRNWARECAQWLPKRRFLVLPDEKRERLKLLRGLARGDLHFDALAVNYESARLDHTLPELEAILRRVPSVLCLDESQRVKNSQSKSFQAMAVLAPLAKRRVLLSGTPTPKDLTDIWAQINLLDDGERFGNDYYAWLPTIAHLGNSYSEFAIREYKAGAREEVVSRVHEILLRRRKEEVIDLPEKTFSVRDVSLQGEQLKRYEEIRKDLLLRVTSINGHVFVREIDSVLEQYLRAVQVASNPRLIDPTWKGEPAKFIELDQIVQEIVVERESKLVVWTNYLKNIAELEERYKAYGVAPFSGEVSPARRAETIEEFQKGNAIKILVAVPAAGGVGITLTAAQTAVYLERTWNAEHWLQSVDRIHRIGQRGSVNIISLSACRVDDLIGWSLKRKERAQRQLLGDEKGEFEQIPTQAQLIEAVSGVCERRGLAPVQEATWQNEAPVVQSAANGRA